MFIDNRTGHPRMESAGCLYVSQSGKMMFVESPQGLQVPQDIRMYTDDRVYVTALRALFEQTNVDGIFNKMIRIGSKHRLLNGCACLHGLYVCWSGQHQYDKEECNNKLPAKEVSLTELSSLPALPKNTLEDLAAFHSFVASAGHLKGWTSRRRVVVGEMLRMLPQNPFGENEYMLERVAICPDV